MNIKKVLKKAIGVSILSVMSLSLVACNGGNNDEIIIGVDDTFAPMGFLDESNELTGFDIDLAKAVGEEMGKEIKFQTINWSMKETELNNNNIDVIWNGYTITDARKKQVDFTPAYLKNRQVIVTLAGSDIKKKSDLSGKKVGAQADSSAVEAIEAESDVMATFDGGQPITFDTNDLVLRDLEAGRIDAVVADEVLINYYINKKGADKYTILDENFGEEEYGIGVRKGDTELLDAINNALNKLKEEGKAQEISIKWFGENKLIY